MVWLTIKIVSSDTIFYLNKIKAGIRSMGELPLKKDFRGDKGRQTNSCKIKYKIYGIAMSNKSYKISICYLIFKYSFNFWDSFLIIIFLTKIKIEKNNNILIKNIINPNNLMKFKIFFLNNNKCISIKSQEKYYDIIRQKTTDAIIPAKSASSAQINTKRVFLIPIQLVYSAMVYKVVSVEPIIVAAIKPIKESTPNFCIISVAIAVEALPDIGLSKANGKISGGIFNRLRNGVIEFVKASIIPDSLKTFIDKNSPSNVGKIFKTIFNPSFAPSKKTSNTDCLSSIP